LILIQSSNEFKTYLKMLLEIYLEKEKYKIHFPPPFFISARWPSSFGRWPFPPRQPPVQPRASLGPASRASPARLPLARCAAQHRCRPSPAERPGSNRRRVFLPSR